MNEIIGFAPDLPTNTPGILTYCQNWIPYETGMRAAESYVAYSVALAAECLGAATLTKLDKSRRVFAGTAVKLYELSGTSWTDRTGTVPNLGATSRWCFTQFGDTSIAASIDTTLQSSASGVFADISGAPKAAIAESVLSSGGGFVMLFNTIDVTYGTRPDAWWCSGINTTTTWTPSVAVQCGTGRLLGTEGPIVAARKLGSDRVVAYKSNALYVGTYVGGTTIWSWQETTGWGVAGLDAVADIGGAHFCVGENDIYIFDGSRPIPVSKKLREWFIAECSGTFRYRTIVQHNKDTDLVYIWFPSAGSADGRPDRTLVYHISTGKWGRMDNHIQAALIFNTPTDTFNTGSGTFDADTVTFDSLSPGSRQLAIFGIDNVMYTVTGTPASSAFTLHDIGDDATVTRCTEARLRYMTKPTQARMNSFHSMATGSAFTGGVLSNSYDVPANGSNVFPMRGTGRWHKLTFGFFGNCKVTGYQVNVHPAGKR